MTRHLRILDLALASLSRSPFRTVSVVTAYTLLVALMASLLMFVNALRRETRSLLEPAPTLIVQRLRGGRHEPLPTARCDEIRSIRGVASATPRVWGYAYDPPTGATFTVWGADSVPRQAVDGDDTFGRMGDADPNVCIVGQGVADLHFLGVGDRLPMAGFGGALVAPRVDGVFTSQSALLTNDLVVMPSATVRRFLGIVAEDCIDIAVDVLNPAEVAIVARKIQQRWPDSRLVTRAQIQQTYDAAFDWRGGVWATALLCLVGAFFVLSWDRASGLTAEDRHLIGILKAVGWSSRQVLEFKLCEGLLISSFAVLSGLLLAFAHLDLLGGRLFVPVVKGWSVLYPHFDLPARLDAITVAVCFALVVLPFTAASVVPAWRAATTDPDTALRS